MTSWSSSQQVTLVVDRAEAKRLGVEMSAVTGTLNNAFGQRQVSTIYNALNQYRVVMEVAPEQAQGPEALDRLYVLARGQRIPLSAFSRYERSVADDRVSHSGQFASTTISFEIKPGISFSQARGLDQRSGAPAGDAWIGAGQAGGERAAVPEDAGESAARDSRHASHRLYRAGRAVRELHAPADHPVDTALGGRGRACWHCRRSTPSSASSRMLGLFLLVGVVMKNAILMIDVALQLERERGLTPHVAIREACLLRLRPILMTTMAALLGALPLVLGAGEGSELRKPLGIAIVGGLAVSQVLTLYTTPVVYLYLDRLRLWGTGRRHRAAVPAPSPSLASLQNDASR